MNTKIVLALNFPTFLPIKSRLLHISTKFQIVKQIFCYDRKIYRKKQRRFYRVIEHFPRIPGLGYTKTKNIYYIQFTYWIRNYKMNCKDYGDRYFIVCKPFLIEFCCFTCYKTNITRQRSTIRFFESLGQSVL